MKIKLPRIKPIQAPMRLSGGRIRVGALCGIGVELEDDAEGNIWRLLGLMDGSRSADCIVQDMRQVVPDLAEESIYQAIDELIGQGFVEDAGADPPPEFSQAERERYSRNLSYFSRVDTEPRASPYSHQLRLKQATVTVLGLGGSGAAMAMSLAAVGVGALHIVDCDRVEGSNLNRQLLYREVDIGRSKVEVALVQLRQLNPYITVTGQELEVNSREDLAPLMEGRDLFVLCADTPPVQIQRWTNAAALSTGTPWLICYYSGPVLGTGIFVPFVTPCYECLKEEENRQLVALDEGILEFLFEPPTIQPVTVQIASLNGHLGALEAVNFLTDLRPQTVGRIFHYDLMAYDQGYYTQVPFWPQCPACGQNSPYRQFDKEGHL